MQNVTTRFLKESEVDRKAMMLCFVYCHKNGKTENGATITNVIHHIILRFFADRIAQEAQTMRAMESEAKVSIPR